MNTTQIINSAKAIRRSFKARAAKMSAKAAGVFALAYGGGAILALIVNGFLPLNSYLGFLNIGVYGSITVVAIVIGTFFTYPILVAANRQFRTQD